MANLQVNIAGVSFKNPVIAASIVTRKDRLRRSTAASEAFCLKLSINISFLFAKTKSSRHFRTSHII